MREEYVKKDPPDYKNMVENLRMPTWWDLESTEATLLDDAADVIEDLVKYKEAVERMGNFGKLFVSYAGDPRGPMGRSGERDIVKEALSQPVITDVDGGTWRPVYEEVMQNLIKQLEWWKEQNFRACYEKEELKKSAEAAERREKLLEDENRILTERITKAETRIERMKSIMRCEGIAFISEDISGSKSEHIEGAEKDGMHRGQMPDAGTV